jgi:ABC transport system ATP-binding/permease protein
MVGPSATGTNPMFKLVIQDDEGKTTVVPLVRDEITIGRKEGNTIRLTERNVSRRHARIVRNNGEVTIEDLGSYNGIRVNNARIAERVQLRVSDQVQIGDYKLFLKAEGIEHVDDARTVPIERIESATTVDAVAVENTTPTVPLGPQASQGPGGPGAPGSIPPAAMQMVGNPNRTMVAIADTDPAGRPLASAAVVASLSAPVGHARLVVLSSNFAGSEFELSRPQMIIGRTDENDIVINHRSISRNHAKLVREPDTGRYTVSDLQSSNGVRVNGQDYGKVELRRGDVIDLGHVRMRFVDAGEEYVFTRDAIEDVPEEGKGRGLWVAIAVAALLLGGIGIYFAFLRSPSGGGSGGDIAETNPKNPLTNPSTTPDAAMAVVEADAAPANPPPQTPDASTTPPVNDDVVKRKRSECAQMQSDERWAELKKCAGELRGLKGTAPEDVTAATDFARQSGIEIASKAQLDKFLAAQKADDMRGMAAIARSFNKASMYAQQVQEKWESEKGKYVAGKAAQARGAAKGGKCGELRTLATSVRAYDARTADEIAGLPCAVATVTPAVDCTDPVVNTATEKLFQEIQDARIADPKAAIRLVEQALANNKCLASKKAILVRIGVVAACSEKREDKVMFFFLKSKDPSLVQACPEYLGDAVK